MDSTPASLLEQMRGPDRGPAWVRFVRLYTPLLAHWADRTGVPLADRADLIQEVFLVLVRVAPTFQYEPSRSFRAWLHTVLVNKWKDHRRKKSAMQLTMDENRAEIAIEDPVPLLAEAEYRAVLVARAARLIESDFNRTTWQAFWRTAVEGCSPPAVALELGLSLNAVYLARSRVLARLRQELAGLWD